MPKDVGLTSQATVCFSKLDVTIFPLSIKPVLWKKRTWAWPHTLLIPALGGFRQKEPNHPETGGQLAARDRLKEQTIK